MTKADVDAALAIADTRDDIKRAALVAAVGAAQVAAVQVSGIGSDCPEGEREFLIVPRR